MAYGLDDYERAVASIESSGNHRAIGPVTRNGDRAFGLHQVMGQNVGPWTQAALGRSMTPQEFLDDPDAQKAVFKHRFGSYVDQYGNPQDAASMWFSGRPMSRAGNADDGYNTVPQYVDKFNKALTNPMAMAFNESSNMTPMMAAMRMFPGASRGQQQGPLPPDASLSDKFIAGGPGALFGAPNGVFQNDQGQQGYDLGTGLQGAGTYLMGISDPKALGALGAINKDTADYSVVQGGDGSLIRVNKRTGQVEKITGAGPTDAQKAYDTTVAKSFADMNSKIPTDAQAASGKIGQIQQLRDLFSNPDVYQGAGGDWIQNAKKIGNTLGMDFKGVADADVARALSNQMALEIRSVANGAGMPGSLSDKDLAFLKSSVAGLDNTKEANQKLLDYYERLHKRSLDVENLRQQYVGQNGRLDEGFNRVVRDYSNKNVLFGDADQYKPMQTGRGDRQPLSSFKR